MRHRHGRRWSPTHWLRKRTQRSVFAWILLIIFGTAITVGTLLRIFGTESGWRDDFRRAETFIAQRFADAWNDPAALHALTRNTATELDATVRVLNLRNERLANAGSGDCVRPWRIAIAQRAIAQRGIGQRGIGQRGNRVGTLELCLDRRRHSHGIFLVALLLSGALLWKGAGAISRRLAKPIETLAHAATQLGDGHWHTRMQLEQHHPAESHLLAKVFNRMAERVETQISDQKTLLAAVSHELRTPLARMRLIAELGKSKSDTEHWQRIDREIDELDTLVADLLASSRMDFVTRPETKLDARDLMLRAIESARVDPTLLSLADSALSEAARKILGDATLLTRALSNLLENAKKHGGGVQAIEIDANPTQVIFTVSDDGPGLDPHDIAKVFAPFYRGVRGPSENSNTGFGLALVRRVAEWHGGSARVENREPRGARFMMVLPRSV